MHAAKKSKKWVAVVGPTGSGKSALALDLAKALNGEIVGCDSVQLYRGFDIGSAKPSKAEQALVPHHLIDVFDWHQEADAALYASLARDAIQDILSHGKLPIVTGGTGLYLRALLGGGWNRDLPKDEKLRKELDAEDPTLLYERLKELDPVRARALHPNDLFRIKRALELVILLGKPLHEAGFDATKPGEDVAFTIVLDPPRSILHDRIALRTKLMLDSGLLQEVEGLLAAGVNPSAKPMRSIGYKEACGVISGDVSKEIVYESIVASTRQYAKRQCTWFRKVAADVRITEQGFESLLSALKEHFSEV